MHIINILSWQGHYTGLDFSKALLARPRGNRKDFFSILLASKQCRTMTTVLLELCSWAKCFASPLNAQDYVRSCDQVLPQEFGFGEQPADVRHIASPDTEAAVAADRGNQSRRGYQIWLHFGLAKQPE